MSEAVITIDNLTKFYDGRAVLDGINLSIPKGCIYGLLGRNGTGKTTLIRILLGQESPTRGTTGIFGTDSAALTAAQRGRIGYVAEAHNLIQNYKVSRLVRLCRSLAANWNEGFFSHLIQKFNLPFDRKVKELSMGMRAQLNLTLAMSIEPEILILDDPTLGLDTVARRQFLELAVELIQEDHRTILFSSHILSDVERVADRVGMLIGGRLVVDCPLEDLKNRVKKLRLIFPGAAPKSLHMTDIINQQHDGRELTITIANLNDEKKAIIDTFKPSSCTEMPMSLEDIFIECTKPLEAPTAS